MKGEHGDVQRGQRRVALGGDFDRVDRKRRTAARTQRVAARRRCQYHGRRHAAGVGRDRVKQRAHAGIIRRGGDGNDGVFKRQCA